MIYMKDAETGNQVWVDSSLRRVREHYTRYWKSKTYHTHEVLGKLGIDYADIATHEDYVKPLMQLFKKRA